MMHTIQYRYASAKALADLAREAADARIAREVPPVSRHMTDEELKTHAMTVTRIDAECHVWATHDAQIEAEKSLLAWTQEQIHTVPAYAAHKEDMAYLFANAKKHPKLYADLIRTCMQLRPAEADGRTP